MNADVVLESQLHSAIKLCGGYDSPPKLLAAIKHAVFPGGARIRPKLCLAVSDACNNSESNLAMASAVAIELLHCASLVHDDLPCFDNADTRRGQLSVHKAYDERIAVLTGDALIVLAFRVIGSCKTKNLDRFSAVFQSITEGVGAPSGIIAGQAWECESKASLKQYQRAKTGSLFVAATSSGAATGGDYSKNWRDLGEALGEAYQVADDIRDVISNPNELGKPIGQDEVLGRMSSAKELGLSGAVEYFDFLINKAVSVIPSCERDDYLKKLIKKESQRLVPKKGRIKIIKTAHNLHTKKKSPVISIL
jgi:geranylgeranyl diphosphate synthase type II